MWAEFHVGTGALIYGGAYAFSGGEPNIAPAIALACMSHTILDDPNVGSIFVYHGWGETLPRKIATSIVRAFFWSALIFWVFWNHPMALAVALPAWLICDWEWFYKFNVGVGIHHDRGNWWFMYPSWIKTQWALIPVLIAIILFIWAVT